MGGHFDPGIDVHLDLRRWALPFALVFAVIGERKNRQALLALHVMCLKISWISEPFDPVVRREARALRAEEKTRGDR